MKNIFRLDCDWKEMFDFSYIEECVETLRVNFPNNKIYFYDLETGSDSYSLIISIFKFSEINNDALIILSTSNEDEDDFPSDFNINMVNKYTIINIDEKILDLVHRFKKLIQNDLSDDDEKEVYKYLNQLKNTIYDRPIELINIQNILETIENKFK